MKYVVLKYILLIISLFSESLHANLLGCLMCPQYFTISVYENLEAYHKQREAKGMGYIKYSFSHQYLVFSKRLINYLYDAENTFLGSVIFMQDNKSKKWHLEKMTSTENKLFAQVSTKLIEIMGEDSFLDTLRGDALLLHPIGVPKSLAIENKGFKQAL
jgi:hypothetical protein